ncbi:hypothetical protein H6F39_15945 [Anabaena sp. FACHB-1250]|uniref:hypothetical protein n=1 Tax=Anabaena sp. FACHB-1250 TaxID=2692770 RepID=UPI0016812796|nr:hypothetical protein [Anabaena sp. FACHB-1250]MBD2142816.1 hypothetical protein [Anabaena sp. FACHB-1250]
MANIQIADLAQVENQFDELSDLELEVVGGRSRWSRPVYSYWRPPVSQSWWFRPSNAIIW